MKERIIKISLAVALISATCTASKAQEITLLSGDVAIPITKQQTQTEKKPGWKIVDIQLKDKLKRYLWGRKAKQSADDNSPRFIIDTDSLLLSDLVVIKLKQKKEYRNIPKPQIHKNKCIHVDFSTFHIEPYGNDLFLIHPIEPMEPGEYIFTWKTASPVGEMEDWIVWPFSIEE